MPTLVGNKQLFHQSLPSQDARFPSFDRKWTDPIRQMDIEMSVPVPKYCLQSKMVYSLNGNPLNISTVRKSKIKTKNAWLKYEINTIE